MNRYGWILFIVMLGFAGLGVETRYLHQVAVTEKIAAWLPTIVAFLGVIACLLAYSRGRMSRAVSVVLLLVAVAAGPLGVYFHTGFRTHEILRVLHKEPDRILMKTRKGDIAPPADAPLAFSGLALIGLLAASGHWAARNQNRAITHDEAAA